LAKRQSDKDERDKFLIEYELVSGAKRIKVQPKLFYGGRMHVRYGSRSYFEDEREVAREERDRLVAELTAEHAEWQAAQKRSAGATILNGDAETVGVTAGEEPNVDEVLARAYAEWDKTAALEARRQNQSIALPGRVTTIVGLGDQHAGSPGSDYPRMFEEARIIRDTPGMYCVLLGDTIDNFVAPKLVAQIRTGTRLSIPDEAVIAREYLSILAPKIIAVVSGNHEGWTQQLAGIDYFQSVIAQINPRCLYDPFNLWAKVTVGDFSRRMAMSHAWRGKSMYNPTHAFIRSRLIDGKRYDFGFGGHTHRCGSYQSFPDEGETVLALLAGSYKIVDDFGRRLSLAAPNKATAISVMLDSREHAMIPLDDLALAARLTRLALADAERTVRAV
jgi:hypothetical protein